MAISNAKQKNMVSGGRYTFPVNCEDCKYNDIKSGCVFSRCIYLELPKPNVLSIRKKCDICGEVMTRPVYSNQTICEKCRKSLKELLHRDGEDDDGK